MKYFRISTAFVLMGFSVFFLFQNCASKDQVFESTTPTTKDSASTTTPNGTTSSTVGTNAEAQYNPPVPVAITQSSTINVATGALIGNIDGIEIKSADTYVLAGWACAKGLTASINVQFFNGPWVAGKQMIGTEQTANVASEQAVNSACGANGNHRFEIPIPISIINAQKSATAAPYQIYVYAINPDKTKENLVLGGSGKFVIPPNFGKVFGHVNGISKDTSGNQSIYGWACIKGVLNPLSIHIYAQKKDPTTQKISEIMLKDSIANKVSETAIASECLTSAYYRFSVPITSEYVANYKLSPINVYGIGLVSGYTPDNPALSDGDGVYLMPESMTQTQVYKVTHVDLINSKLKALLSTYDDFRDYTASQLCKIIDSDYVGATSVANAECVAIENITQPVYSCTNGNCGTTAVLPGQGICSGKVISKLDCFR